MWSWPTVGVKMIHTNGGKKAIARPLLDLARLSSCKEIRGALAEPISTDYDSTWSATSDYQSRFASGDANQGRQHPRYVRDNDPRAPHGFDITDAGFVEVVDDLDIDISCFRAFNIFVLLEVRFDIVVFHDCYPQFSCDTARCKSQKAINPLMMTQTEMIP